MIIKCGTDSNIKVTVHHFRKIGGCLDSHYSCHHWYSFHLPKMFCTCRSHEKLGSKSQLFKSADSIFNLKRKSELCFKLENNK